MNNITIMTDSSCDIPKNIIEEHKVSMIPLHFHFENQIEYGTERIMDSKEFYEKLQDGGVAKTSACSPSSAMERMKAELDKGNDIICITISSGLSCSFNNVRIASLELLDSYPERRITVIDSLTGSIAMGQMVAKACVMKKEGSSYDEIVDYLNKHKHSYHVEFFVNDLQYLVRGGRLNPAVAKIGGIMGIRPILTVTDEGKIEVACKARKKSGALKQLKERFLESAADKKEVYIVHSNDPETAEALKEELLLKHSISDVYICELCPTIGCHIGPGCLGISYVKENV